MGKYPSCTEDAFRTVVRIREEDKKERISFRTLVGFAEDDSVGEHDMRYYTQGTV